MITILNRVINTSNRIKPSTYLNYRLYSTNNINNNDITNTTPKKSYSPSFKRVSSDEKNYNNKYNNNSNNNVYNKRDNKRDNKREEYGNNNFIKNKHNSINSNNYNTSNNSEKRNLNKEKYYKLQDEAVYGINPVWVALTSENRSFNALYVCGSILRKLKTMGIDITQIENTSKKQQDEFNNELNNYSNNNNSEEEEYSNEEEEEEINTTTTAAQPNRYQDRKNVNALREIIENSLKLKIPIIAVNRGAMNSFSKSRPHQGVVLDASPLTLLSIDFLEPYKKQGSNSRYPLWLVLDELWDPQNVGAIIRSCCFFGVDGVVLSDKNSSPITSTASKSSSGAVEGYLMHRSESIQGFLRSSKLNGWKIVGTSLDDVNCECVEITDIKLDKPTILLIGNEGFGLKQNILELCDKTIKISGGNSKIDSLNVSVTSGILIHQLLTSSPLSKKK